MSRTHRKHKPRSKLALSRPSVLKTIKQQRAAKRRRLRKEWL